MSSLLVVAGEASGDRAAAAVCARLPGVEAFGLGGPSLESTGVELVSDLRASTALGLTEAAARAAAILRAYHAVIVAVRRRRPAAALLVDYTEFNVRLAPLLKASSIRVLWYGAPQVWAWRAQRVARLARLVDCMAVVLPFEEPLWRKAGADAHYVGHPAMEIPTLGRARAREHLGMTPYAAAVAILPGSRPHEVSALLAPMLAAYASLRSERASVDARVLVAPSLDDASRARLRGLCDRQRVEAIEVDPRASAKSLLAAFDVALCASGTACLEATLARAVPVVAYRVGLFTELAARLLLRVPHIALPNVLLGRRAFVELVQRDASAGRMASALAETLDGRTSLLHACAEVEARLGGANRPSLAVARLLAPWVGAAADAS